MFALETLRSCWRVFLLCEAFQIANVSRRPVAPFCFPRHNSSELKMKSTLETIDRCVVKINWIRSSFDKSFGRSVEFLAFATWARAQLSFSLVTSTLAARWCPRSYPEKHSL
jgi:hypothetical protein